MECNVCDNLEHLHVYDIEDLMDTLMDIMGDNDINGICIVADQDYTKELLYYSINGDYNVGFIELNPYEYDGPYLTTINWEGDNYSITIQKACSDAVKYFASGHKTYIQYDLPEKCEYIIDVTNNKYVDVDLAILEFGESCDCEDECDEERSLYTYANEYKEDGVFGQIFVSSNLKDFVEIVKQDFECIFAN